MLSRVFRVLSQRVPAASLMRSARMFGGHSHHAAPAVAIKAAPAELNTEEVGEEPNGALGQFEIDEATRKEVLAEHPHDNAEDVLAAYAAPRNVMGPIIGPFGTRKRPTLVPSGYDARIIACTGGHAETGYGRAHEAMWLSVEDNGKKYACDECGQVFKLLRLKGTKHAHGSHH